MKSTGRGSRPLSSSLSPTVAAAGTSQKKRTSQPSSPAQAAPSSNVWKARQENMQTKKNIGVMHDRMLYLFANLVGLSVRATVNSGTIYEGIFHGVNTEGKTSLVLKMACAVDSSTGKANLSLSTVVPTLVIEHKDLYSIEAIDIDVTFADRGVLSDSQDFQTDTAISGHSGDLIERKLEKWVPDQSVPSLSLDDSTGGSGSASWDQFAVNEKLFGVKTDYQEEFYTTKLDKNSEEYKKKEKEASKLAAEIEKSVADNVHVAEERGTFVDDSQMDEEDRYGAVIRKPGSYLPPAARKAIEEAVNSTKPNSHEIKDKKPIQKPFEEKPKDVLVSVKVANEATSKVSVESNEKNISTSTLNPNVSSFKFNLKAAEFKPVFAPSPAATSEASLKPISSNIFGKRVSKEKMSIKEALLKNYHSNDIQREVHDSDFTWQTGSQSYIDLAQAAMNMYPVVPISYGYPQMQAPVVGYPLVPQSYGVHPQFQQGAYGGPMGAHPGFIPGQQVMPMQYGYQPIVYIPNAQQQPSPPDH